MTINISTASSRDLTSGLPQSMGSMPQPQLGRSLPCDGSMLEVALTRLANELYAAPPGGAAGGLPPLAVGATPTSFAAPNFAAPASAATPGGAAAGFGAQLSSPTFGALDSAPGGFNAPGGFKQSPFDPVGASPAVTEGADFAPAPKHQSLGAGGGTATPAPPFPTTAGQQQSGVSLPGGHPPQTLQSVDDDKLQSVLQQSNISGVPNNRSGAPASGVNSGPSVVPGSSNAVNRVEDGSTFYFLNEAHKFARLSTPPGDLLPVPGVSLPSSAPRVSQPIPTGAAPLHQPFSVEAIDPK